MAPEAESCKARPALPSIDGALGARLLPAALGRTAGNVGVISFLGLGGLFAAHITGNLAIILDAAVGRPLPALRRTSQPRMVASGRQ